VPILELRQRLSFGEAPEETRPVMISVEVQGRTLGLRVESVSNVLDLDRLLTDGELQSLEAATA
jgi:chemotaxis signal transduction protein